MTKYRVQVPSFEAYQEASGKAREEGWKDLASSTSSYYGSATFRKPNGDEVRIVFDPQCLDHERDRAGEVESDETLFNRAWEAAQAAKAFVEDMQRRGAKRIDDEAVRYHLARLLKRRAMPCAPRHGRSRVGVHGLQRRAYAGSR